jgi:hypothetical protein
VGGCSGPIGDVGKRLGRGMRRCEHCGGSVLRFDYVEGTEYICLSCGRPHDGAEELRNGVAQFKALRPLKWVREALLRASS